MILASKQSKLPSSVKISGLISIRFASFSFNILNLASDKICWQGIIYYPTENKSFEKYRKHFSGWAGKSKTDEFVDAHAHLGW